jgi:zinc protease
MRVLRNISILAALWLGLASEGTRALNVDVSTFTLGNGMQVVVIPDHRAPVVTHMVWYRAGAADEPEGEAGVAHFLEHLLFKGTPRYPAGQFSLIVRKNGGEENAFTTQDYTAYYQRIARDRLPLVMELEADRMQNLILTDKEVLPERQVILEERRERTENDPQGLLGEQMNAALYTAHPYGKPVIGWRNQMEKLTREDAISFYRRHYTPANAVLVVAGDVTADEVKPLAERYYGVLKNSFEPSPRVRQEEPEPIAARRVLMSDPRAATPLVQRVYLAPSYATAAPREAEALDILAEVLGGGSVSRLYRTLVVRDQIAAYVASWYSGDELDYGTLGVYGSPVPGIDVARVEAAIDGEIASIVRDGITTDELARAKNRLMAESVYALDSQTSLARIFGSALSTGSTVQAVLDWDNVIEAVTIEDVKKAAAKVLDIRRSVTGVLLPAESGVGAEAAPPPEPESTVN